MDGKDLPFPSHYTPLKILPPLGASRSMMVAAPLSSSARALDDTIAEKRPIAAVARTAKVLTQLYKFVQRTMVKALVSKTGAYTSRALHPRRLARALISSRNPMMQSVEVAAEKVKADGECHRPHLQQSRHDEQASPSFDLRLPLDI